jgi:hypothetical protein
MSSFPSPGAMLVALLMAILQPNTGDPPYTGVISGMVQSADGTPMPFASVSLLRSADSVVVAGSVTAASGTFRFDDVATGRYIVEVSHLGYVTATRPDVTISDSTPRVDLGVIRLEPSAIALEGVEVTAARAPFSILADRNVYLTSDMPAAVGGTAVDVLRSVPELEVSNEGTVTAHGATPAIHINGRPAPMQGEALDQYLQQLPAERIERIEVISNPSARYEAHGQGGIINIVMKRGTSVGLSGSVSLNAGTGSQRGGSGSINYQAGRLSLFGSASASFFGNERENSDLRQNLATQPETWIQQDSRDRSSGGFTSADIGAEVKLGPQGTLWTDVSVARNTADSEVVTAYTHLDAGRNPTQRYDRLNDTDRRGSFGSLAVGYGDFGEEREWSVQLRRDFSDDDDDSESLRCWLAVDGSALDLEPELTFAGEGRDRDGLSLEANLMRAWGEWQVEAGYRGSWRNTRSAFRMDIEAPDNAGVEAVAGDFRHREQVLAGFVSASGQIGRFNLHVGLRAEHADLRSELPLLDGDFGNSYLDLFPSASISTTVGTGGQLRLSYSRRVDRPHPGILNPATPELDPLNRRIGNPGLAPRYTHAFTLMASRTGRLGSLQLSPFYRRTVDSWDQVRTVDEAGVSTVSWQNVATVTSYGGNVNASLTQLGPLSGFMSVRAYREVREGSDLSADYSGSAMRMSLVGNANMRATEALSLQGMLTYLPAREVPQGRISSMVFTTIGARQQLWDGRGSINVSVVDPFELQRFSFRTRDGTHVQFGNSSFSARRMTIGVSYSFGRPQGNRRRGPQEEGQSEGDVQRIR